MTDTGAIRATFSQYAMVKTRGVLVLHMEIPLEQQAELFAVLGYPLPGVETWVGIARLQAPAQDPEGHRAQSDATKAGGVSPAAPEGDYHLPYGVTREAAPASLPSEAGLAEVERRQAASERGKAAYAASDAGRQAVTRAAMLCDDPKFQEWCKRPTSTGARLHILMMCHINSRRDLATNSQALACFERMETDFNLWAGRLPEMRGSGTQPVSRPYSHGGTP